MEAHLRSFGYENWPACGEEINQSIHCAAPNGFPSDVDAGWLTAYFSGSIPGGTGINQAGWSYPTMVEW